MNKQQIRILAISDEDTHDWPTNIGGYYNKRFNIFYFYMGYKYRTVNKLLKYFPRITAFLF